VTRAIGPRPGAIPPGTGGAYAMLAVMLGAIGLGLVVWLGGHAASFYVGDGWDGPAPTFDNGIRLVTDGGPQVFWPEVPVDLIWGFTGGLLALIVMGAVAVCTKVSASRPVPGDPAGSLATDSDVSQMTPAGARKRAVQLRPSLQGKKPKEITAADAGVPLGRLRPTGTELRASFEDVIYVVMAPRAGKTTALAVNQVLQAPGPVVATSNKADLTCLTAELRERDTSSPVWVFDPQAIAHSEQAFFWNPLRGVDSVEPAQRLASQFIIAIRGERRAGADFWLAAAEDVLTSLFLAAGSTRGDLGLADVYRWLNRPTDPLPVRLLEHHGHRSRAESLAGAQAGAMETREGIFQTARTAARCLGDPQIMRWVTRPGAGAGLPEFETDKFARTRQTLYLLAKENAGGAGPLVAGFCDRILQDAVKQAERNGGRLDPPLVAVLDEMCNLPLADLPSLYSHLGSRSIVPIGIAQSWSQTVGVWGETAAKALWGASTVKVIGAGVDDPQFLQGLSELIGDHDVNTRSLQYGYRNSSESLHLRRQRIMPVERLRDLPKGSALVLNTGSKVAAVDLQPWFTGNRRAEIESANRRAVAALTARAAESSNAEAPPSRGPDALKPAAVAPQQAGSAVEAMP